LTIELGGVIFSASFVKYKFPMDKRIFHLKKRLSQDLGRDWTAEDMAVAANMSLSNFHRLFRITNGGVTPKAFLHDLRLDRAAEMLGDPECVLRISEIGNAVGLINESHFAADFKKKFGMTPTQYQTNQAEIHQSRPQNYSDGQE